MVLMFDKHFLHKTTTKENHNVGPKIQNSRQNTHLKRFNQKEIFTIFTMKSNMTALLPVKDGPRWSVINGDAKTNIGNF